jgi:mRNA interferase RelE/StbE
MFYQVIIPKRVEKAILKLDSKTQQRIFTKLRQLAINPLASGLDIKHMQGTDYTYRLRLGKLRILMDVIAEKREIHLLKVGFRGDVYKK